MSKVGILKKLLFISLTIIILFTLSGCKNKKSDMDMAKEKIEEEVEYLDKRIISMMNIINNVSFTNYKVVSENVKQEDSKNTKESNNSENKGDSSESNGESEKQESSSQSDTNAEKGEGKEQSGDNEQNENKNMIYKLTENNILDNNSETSIQWNEVKKEVENVYTIWTTMVIDMRQAKIEDRDIEQFSFCLDKLAKAVKNENKQESLNELSNLYSILPMFLEQNSSDKFKVTLYKTKADILSAYFIISTEEDWKKAEDSLIKANEDFKSIEENNNLDKNKTQNIIKVGILLQDLNKCIKTEDKQIFFLRYKNVMQEINTM